MAGVFYLASHRHLKMFDFTNGIVIFAALFYILFLSRFSCYASPNVIVVGAGASGIAAASKLLQHNFTNIMILEAENRIGGRVYSAAFGDAFVDLGAEWCHGEEGNIVYQMVEDLDVLRPGVMLHNSYYSTREDLDKEFILELYNMFMSIYNEDKPDGTTLGDYMTKRYNESVIKKYGNDPDKLKLANEFSNLMMHVALTLEGAFFLFTVSAISDRENCEGNIYLSWKGRGYKTVLEVLMKTYPSFDKQLPIDDKIILNKEVVQIVWNDCDKLYASVKCKDGSTYDADHVIFTPSLGVLKNSIQEPYFIPDLPKEKRKVIETLGIDAVHKAILLFPLRWWRETNFTDILFIWSEEDKKRLIQEFPNGPSKNGISWLADFIGLLAVDIENPKVLIAWFSGEFVPEIEKCSDELLIDGIMFVLNKHVGHQYENMTKPVSVIRNNWYANPHFRGTYSYQTVESRKFEESSGIIYQNHLHHVMANNLYCLPVKPLIQFIILLSMEQLKQDIDWLNE